MMGVRASQYVEAAETIDASRLAPANKRALLEGVFLRFYEEQDIGAADGEGLLCAVKLTRSWQTSEGKDKRRIAEILIRNGGDVNAIGLDSLFRRGTSARCASSSPRSSATRSSTPTESSSRWSGPCRAKASSSGRSSRSARSRGS